MNKVMVLKGGSPAIHKLGDIGRKNDDFIRVHSETEDYFIGNFEEGFGFIEVKFKKEECRSLTESEIKDLNGKWYTINDAPLYKIYVDEDGNVVKGKCIMKKGNIINVTDSDGLGKHHAWHGLRVEFPEDIELGQSVVLMVDEGCITTSKVSNVEIFDDKYVIHTKNSVYYISL